MKRTAILTALAILASAAGAGAQQASAYWQFDNCSSPVFTAAGAQQASVYYHTCLHPVFTAAGVSCALWLSISTWSSLIRVPTNTNGRILVSCR